MNLATASPDSTRGRRSSSDTKDSGKGGLSISLPYIREQQQRGTDFHQARLAAQARLEAARRFPRFQTSITDEDGKLLGSEGLAGFMGDLGSRISYCLAPDAGGCDERGGLVGLAEVLCDGGEDLFGRGDVSSNCGGGFGAGTVVPDGFLLGRGEEPVQQQAGKGKLTKSNNSGGGGSGRKGAGRWGEGEVTKVREGCNGRWNSDNGGEEPVDSKGAKVERWWHVERGRWRARIELS